MEKKKLKLSITGKSKKTIDNIELARSKGKNSVIIEKKIQSLDQRHHLTKVILIEIHLIKLNRIFHTKTQLLLNRPSPMILKRES